MKLPPRTYDVQSGYALRELEWQELLNWAVDALAAGFDSKSLRVLAGLEQSDSAAEAERLFSMAFVEMGIAPLREDENVCYYTASVVRKMLKKTFTKKDALGRLAGLCLREGYKKELMDFYLLYNAYRELESNSVQHYWEGADRSNIEQLIENRAKQWLAGEKGIWELE